MHRRTVAIALLGSAVLAWTMASAVAGAPIPAVDTTLNIEESGAIHVRVLQTVPESTEGVTSYHFDLQKTYSPENVAVYGAAGQPLKYRVTENSDLYSYDVSFDRPYYDGYQFTVEYDCHKRIIYEGSGVYSLSMRPPMDARMIDRTYTIVLPPANFTYIGYNAALDHPVSVTSAGGSTQITFHNVSNVGADYAWEIKFRATGIGDEARNMATTSYGIPVPGMSFMAAAAALLILALLKRKS